MKSYADVYGTFLKDKHDFFKSNAYLVDKSQRISRAKQTAYYTSYYKLAHDRGLIEQELQQLLESMAHLSKSNDEANFSFLLYCYYCCQLLTSYYTKYGSPEKVEKYTQLGQHLEQCCYSNELTPAPTALRTMASDIVDLLCTPFHTTRIIEKISMGNVRRLQLVFSLIAVKKWLMFAAELNPAAMDFVLQWIGKTLSSMSQLFSKSINIETALATLNKPAPVFNVLSVGFFAARFMINTCLMLKHSCFPSDKDDDMTTWQRFLNEWDKRHCTMLNDAAWGVVNGLSNFSAFFHVAAPVANGLTAGFLFFDVAMLMYRCRLAQQDYKIKKAQYDAEILMYDQLLEEIDRSLNDSDDDSFEALRVQRGALLLHREMVSSQLTQLELQWKTTLATYQFNVVAATFLMGGFTASLLFMMPVAIPICYLVCVLAIAMYLSADSYGKYKNASFVMEAHRREHGSVIPVDVINKQKAKNELIMAMVKNTVMPLLIVTTFAICWPAAIALTALFIGYEYGKVYLNSPKPPTLAHDKPFFLPNKGGRPQMSVDLQQANNQQVFDEDMSDTVEEDEVSERGLSPTS